VAVLSATDAALMALTGHTKAQMLNLDRMPWQLKVAAIVDRWGVRGAVPRLGVDRRTLQRWRTQAGHAQAPKPASQGKIDRAFRLSQLRASVPTDSSIRLHTRDRDSDRERTLDARSLQLRQGTVAKMTEAYLAGRYAKAGRELIAGIGVWQLAGAEGARRRQARGGHRPRPRDGPGLRAGGVRRHR
jgi:transposase-like protein